MRPTAIGSEPRTPGASSPCLWAGFLLTILHRTKLLIPWSLAFFVGPGWAIPSNPYLINLLPGWQLSFDETAFQANSGWSTPYFLTSNNRDDSSLHCALLSFLACGRTKTLRAAASPALSWGEVWGSWGEEEWVELRRAEPCSGLKGTIDRLWKETEQALGRQLLKKQLQVGRCKLLSEL